MKHKCPREECEWEWESRVKKPKQCPRCKRYLPLSEYQKREKQKQIKNDKKK